MEPIPTTAKNGVFYIYSCSGIKVTSRFLQRPNPKSLTGDNNRLWLRIKVDSGIELPIVNVLE